MSAGVLDLVIEQGATYKRVIEYVDENDSPIDLTGYTVRMQIRNNHITNDIILELTDLYISITDALNGEITINIPANITATLPSILGVYDIEIELTGDVERLLQGTVQISPEVTR